MRQAEARTAQNVSGAIDAAATTRDVVVNRSTKGSCAAK